jgi:hypothetical protein
MRLRTKRIYSALAVLLLVLILGMAYLYADSLRIGCQSGAELLTPVSGQGFRIDNTDELGACFAAKVRFRKDAAVDVDIICRQAVAFETCRIWYEQVSSGWWDYIGRMCPVMSFIGGASCDCTRAGVGCRTEPWEVQTVE